MTTLLERPDAPPTPPAPSRTRKRILPRAVSGQEWILLGVIAALWIALGAFTPAFLSANSIQPLFAYVTPICLIGIGMTIVITTGGIDVSVAGMLLVCAVVTAKLLVDVGVSLGVAVAVSVLLGAFLGLLNGLLIAYGRVHPIIITFGTANIFLFIGLTVFDSKVINGLPSTLEWFGRGEAGRTLGLPHAFVLTIILVAIAWWCMRHTVIGRHFYAIGGDPTAARLAGVKVERLTVIAYVTTGAMVGLAAVITLASGTSTLEPSVGAGQELAVIAAVVIGGTSILGGRGSVFGTLLGAILVQTVSSGVTQLGWPSQLSELFVGVFIIIAVGTDILRQRARKGKRL
ncbi:ABC transporter permease [Subtercola endophyticus]|uniref:ABC transporter permease n=1 Tax=Subtercola endophyticus TaxID=2895559 RepID=UPI001E2D05B0|nr:ABC transporter permease [Subtercola endophyticus]UFS58820.1 ABC transporter permease [Subtercola endophyticus]